ncbi:zonular occludens toxin domain-containing protein [Achromobacter xylosoxidans]
MALNIYTGTMGTGKTHEMILSVILPAILIGRRVLTNIDGINEALIHAYLERKYPDRTGVLGSIISVTNEQVENECFYPDVKDLGQPSMVQPGDLVVIDEAWTFYAVDKKLPQRTKDFVRMHRHYTHQEHGHCCDIALAFQAITDIHRFIRSVAEINFRTTKLKNLGLSKTYRVEWFQGGKQTKADILGRRIATYDKDIFPLYQSYAGVGGRELIVDKRQNVLRNPRIWLTALVALGSFIGSVWFIYGTFSGSKRHGASENTPKSLSREIVEVSDPVRASDVAPQKSQDKRVAGLVTLSGGTLVIVVDKAGRFIYDSPFHYVGKGAFISGKYKNQMVDVQPFTP